MNVEKKQDFLFNNYKLLLVTLVVIGHFLDMNYKNNSFLYNIKWLIYSFHVPAFVFISGYFSKNRKSLKQLVRSVLVPYLLLEVIYYFYYIYILHRPTGLYLLYPKFSLWYLVCIFIWRIITPYFVKIPGHLLLSVIPGLLIGLSDMKDNFLTFPRVLVFYPFFLLGYHITRENVSTLRNRLGTIKSLLITCMCFFAVYMIAHYGDVSVKIFYGRYNYDFLKQTPLTGVAYRLLFYILGTILTLSILCLIPDKQYRISKWGYNTMPIYLGHGFVYNYFKQTTWLAGVASVSDTILMMALCLLLVIILAQPPFRKMMDIISGKRSR